MNLMWLNEQQLFDSKFDDFRRTHDFDWEWWKFLAFIEPMKYYSFLPRFADNNSIKLCPWKNHLGRKNKFDLSMLKNPVGKDIDELCNNRAKEILKLMNDMQLPIMVHWSGGIDSTVVLVSLLKNFTSEELKNVVVALNISSINENPAFFNKHVLGKFKLFDSSHWAPTVDMLSTHIHITGQYADQLFPTGKILSMERKNPGYALTPLDKSCEWWMRPIITDAANLGINLQNVGDFYWWTSFNYRWSEIELKDILELIDFCTADTYFTYKANHIHWFNTEEFQQWSIGDYDRSTKLDIKQYKIDFKKYIYRYDRNAEYLLYKTKVGSTRSHKFKTPSIFGFLEDGSTIDIDNINSYQLLENFYTVD